MLLLNSIIAHRVQHINKYLILLAVYLPQLDMQKFRSTKYNRIKKIWGLVCVEQPMSGNEVLFDRRKLVQIADTYHLNPAKRRMRDWPIDAQKFIHAVQ